MWPRNLRIRRLDAELLCLMCCITSRFQMNSSSALVLILRHSAQDLQADQIAPEQVQAENFLTSRSMSACESYRPQMVRHSIGSSLRVVRRIVEPDEGNDCQHGDEQH